MVIDQLMDARYNWNHKELNIEGRAFLIVDFHIEEVVRHIGDEESVSTIIEFTTAGQDDLAHVAIPSLANHQLSLTSPDDPTLKIEFVGSIRASGYELNQYGFNSYVHILLA